MKALPVVFSMALLMAAAGGGCADHGTQPAEPKSTPLVKIDAFAVAHREAAKSVAASLADNNESPKEFFADVEPKDDGQVLVFHLWHESAFMPQNRDVEGNPGGKCRDVLYDVRAHKVTETLFWQ